MNLTDSKVSGNKLRKEQSKTIMWIFFFIELFVFGGLFIVYIINRIENPSMFKLAAMELDLTIGTLDTIIILLGGLTVSLSLLAIKKQNKFLSIIFLTTTFFSSIVFSLSKLIEGYILFNNGFYPQSELLSTKTEEINLFFGLFYSISGIYLLHITAGIVILIIVLNSIIRNKLNFNNFSMLENANLFWQLICLIWIFIFPIFYLIN